MRGLALHCQMRYMHCLAMYGAVLLTVLLLQHAAAAICVALLTFLLSLSLALWLPCLQRKLSSASD